MAIMKPDWEAINRQNPRPTEGELNLLKFLDENLSSQYEVFFQPYINGDRPDIVIMKEDTGVLIIEVKDWNLKHYTNHDEEWCVIRDNGVHRILSPYKQVKKYKENLYNLHIPSLLEMNIKNSQMFSIVNCILYFHNSNQEQISYFIKNESPENQKYISILTPDILKKEILDKILDQRYMNKKSKFFTQDLYSRFKRILQPTYHTVEQGIQIKYSKEQEALIKSQPVEKKIKGVAGSGKTMVLAKRAVNSYLRTNSKVLILCYNITLKNYIHDLVSKVRENFKWSYFEINNYHNFITHFLNNKGISTKELFIDIVKKDKKYEKYLNLIHDSKVDFEALLEAISEDLGNDSVSEIWERAIYSNVDLFSNMTLLPEDRYDAVFIDELQDFSYKWLEIIKKNFLNIGGEYILFGDEKQNIYQMELDVDKKVKTNVIGKWDESLKKTFRLHKNIASTASDFQKKYMSSYVFEDIEVVNQFSLFSHTSIKIEYHEFENRPKDIVKFIYEYIEQKFLNPNDIAILGSTISTLRNLDYEYRIISREKTTTTFETQEIFELLLKNTCNSFAKKDNYIASNKKHLEGNLQLALEKIINKIDYLDNPIFNSSKPYRAISTNNDVIGKIIDTISPTIKAEIEKIRKNKKYNFWMNTGHVKFSTIHSFKGWEIPSLFLVIDADLDIRKQHELIYTALTRCRFNLIVISINSNSYRDFFISRSEKTLSED